MKRYKLIKPLPMYEVGDGGFYIDSEGNLMYRASDAGETVYPAPVLVRHPEILKDWFEEIPEEPKTVLDLKAGDKCYIMNDVGELSEHIWYDDFIDHSSRDAGMIFISKEDYYKELAHRRAKVILERDTKGFKPDWNDNDEGKYEVYYAYGKNTLCIVCYCYCCGHKDLWFATKKDAEASIKAHPNEWKTYLGVEE